MDNPTTMPKKSLIGVLNTSKYPTQGLINANSEKNISIAIVNNSNSNMQITLSIVNGYKNGGELIIPEGYTLITKDYDAVPREANTPDLVQGLIPVKYDDDTSSWVKAGMPEVVTATCDSLGDVNGDGKVSAIDSSWAEFISIGKMKYTDSQLVCADVDGDGEITKNDGQLMLNYTVGKVTEFPAGAPLSSRTASVMQSNTWYNYESGLWANAVLVTSTNRSTYQNASVGTPIAESDILAYYVWIPRFKYRVWNISKQAGDETTYAYNAYTEGIDIKLSLIHISEPTRRS